MSTSRDAMDDAPPPPPPPRALESLPSADQRLILRLILRRVPCGVDRGRRSLVCRAWRDVLRRHQAQPPLPWLLLPAAFPEGSTRLACAICDSRVHHYLTITPHGARCFGSHDGGWLLLHYHDREPRGNHALNVHTGAVERLPTQLFCRRVLYAGDVVILSAALSNSPDNASCTTAAIVQLPLLDIDPDAEQSWRICIAFWRKGWELARELVPPNHDDPALQVEDLVYHDGGFNMLTQGNHVRVCKPRIVHQNTIRPFVNWQTRIYEFDGFYDDQLLHSRYLVESRGELLLVLRFTPQPNQPTSKFKVFWEADPFVWREMDTLGGRILFVGHGCSRSYEVDQHPGSEDGVYFLDDGELYDAQVIFGIGNVRRYPCSDNGKWSKEGHVQRFFPRPDSSDHSAPVWLIP